jgi:hypothetical protein
MNRRHRVVRASFYLSLALPLAALSCGDSFTAGSGGDGGEEGGIVFGDGGQGHDATSNVDGSADGPHDAGVHHDGTVGDGMADGPSCPPGWLTCSDGGCAQEGPTSCGSCGNDCTMLPHVMNPQCAAGQCSVTCAPGWQNCTSDAGAGCQTNIAMQGNCGACNVTCSGATPVCSGTGCVSGCDAGQTLCNSTCVDTTNNPQDCKTCGTVCPAGPPNSQPTCTNSVCGWSCDNGYTNCSGSCFDLSNDPNHCNGCTTVCAGLTNGQAVCNAGVCGVVCDTNYQECTLSSGTSCIVAVPDTVHGLFVAPGGALTSCGAESAPCGTVSAALQYLVNGKNIIYVAEGTFTDQVTLPSGVTIQGNWLYMGATQWSRDCAFPPKTIIQAPAGSISAVIASYSSSSSTLDTLTISNPSTAGAGVSLYGVSASNAQATAPGLTLTNVAITVASGGSGVNGTLGAAGVAPAASCTGTSPGGGNGSNGGAGSAGLQGSYGPNGYQPQTGGTGQNGQAGQEGLPAPQKGGTNGPTCITAYTTNATPTYNTDQSCCLVTTGGPCGTCSGTAQPLCGSAGTNGCGSGGSNGGTGGTGGGASVGVFSYNFGITLNQVTITTGNGGTGGTGGTGGGTVSGSTAAAGDAGPGVYTTCTGNCAPFCVCASGGPIVHGNAGIAGGNGGQGGTGGQGGGGSGGDSLCYATAGTTAMVSSTGVTCNAGTAGPGGNSTLSNQGATGRQGLHN